MRENRSGSLGPWRCLLPLEVALRSRGALRPPPSSTATAERCSPSAPAPACQGTRTGPRDGNHLAKVRVAGSNPVSGAMSGSSKAERTKRAKTAAHRRDRPGTLRHPRRPEHGGTTAATQAARRRAQATERQGLWRERERRVGGCQLPNQAHKRQAIDGGQFQRPALSPGHSDSGGAITAGIRGPWHSPGTEPGGHEVLYADVAL